MRQAGILAAAGIYGLKNVAPRMFQDNERASKIAEYTSKQLGFEASASTNAVFIKVGERQQEILNKLLEKGVMAVAMPPDQIRMCMHLHIQDEELEVILQALKYATE